MTEIHDVLYPPNEHDTRVSHRRYDGKERLVAWSVRQADHFLLFRVDAFREVTLENGDKLDVPETIQCRFSQTDIDPDSIFADEGTVSYDSCGNIVSGLEADSTLDQFFRWAGRDLDVETQLQYGRAHWYDPTRGCWISEAPLGHEPGNDDFYPYPQ